MAPRKLRLPARMMRLQAKEGCRKRHASEKDHQAPGSVPLPPLAPNHAATMDADLQTCRNRDRHVLPPTLEVATRVAHPNRTGASVSPDVGPRHRLQLAGPFATSRRVSHSRSRYSSPRKPGHPLAGLPRVPPVTPGRSCQPLAGDGREQAGASRIAHPGGPGARHV